MGLSWSDDTATVDELEYVFDKHFDLIKPISHKLFERFALRPHGLLGVRSQAAKAALNAVVVDAASVEVLESGQVSRACGASREIYDWLALSGRHASLPKPVLQRLRDELHAQHNGTVSPLPTGAKYHRYGHGLHVIHALSPSLRNFEQSVRDLSSAYAAVFRSFCLALPSAERSSDDEASESSTPAIPASLGSIVANPQETPTTLRLQPFSMAGLEDKGYESLQGRIFWSSVAIALELLPLPLQRRLRIATVEVCIPNTKDIQLFEQSRVQVQSGLQLGPDSGRVSKHDGDYEWIRKKNAPADRIERLAASSITMQAIYMGGYYLPSGRAVSLQHVDKMTAGTRIFRPRDDNCSNRPNEAFASGNVTTSLCYATGTAMGLAAHLGQRGSMVVAVNAASAYHVGGGALTGGRHALEESWCITSTLLKSLQQAEYMGSAAEEQLVDSETIGRASGYSSGARPSYSSESAGFHRYLPDDGVVLSPLVEVFREGYTDGYSFLPSAAVLAGVVSLAMYNRNPRVRDSPLDAPSDVVEYEAGVRTKLLAMVLGAVELGAEVLVCPDVGCGVFGNDPALVGRLLGEALRSGPASGHLQQVVITGPRCFAEAVHVGFGGDGNIPTLQGASGSLAV